VARYAAFLRAVNVAGHARIDSAALVAAFAAAGGMNARTCIQSGNVLFTAPRAAAATVAARAASRIEAACGERPAIMLRSAAELAALVTMEPLASCGAAPADKLYVAFLAARLRRPLDLPLESPRERLRAFAQRPREVLVVSSRKPNGFYGFPNNFVEELARVAATTRNWSTVTRVARLIEDMP
jgi:uncharacterized protein (DUF1697 family)